MTTLENQAARRAVARAAKTERKGSVLAGWLSSTDHKIIGHMYLVTSFVFFLGAGIMALLIRIQLLSPTSNFLSDQIYNELFTIHGTIVYRISIGMLYRTCGGSLLPRWRWKITAQMIRPHTTAPTSRPAIHEPCHRDSVIAPCLVTGSGKPMRVKVSFGEHPARASTKTASAP